MIPEKLNILTQDHTLIWTTQNGEITSFDARAISKHIKQIISEQQIERVIVDNRAFKSSWSSEVDLIWIDLMRFMPIHVKKTASLCDDVIAKLQFNYLSSQAGTAETVRAFTLSELSELKRFIDLETLPVDTEINNGH